MFDRRFFAEAVTLVILAAICGTVSNVVAARERKLAFVGSYPNALMVPQKPASPAPAVTDPAPAMESTETTSTDEPVPTETTAVETSPIEDPPVTPGATSTAAPPTTAPAPSVTPPPATPKPAARPARQFHPTPDKVYEEITNADAKQLFDQGALFLDARRTSAFAEGHIPGAHSFAVWEADVDDKVNALFYERPNQQQPIVVYCTGGNCEDSHMLAQKLWGIGYETVLVYTDGFPGWLSIGGAVER